MKKIIAAFALAAFTTACGSTTEDPNLFGGATKFPFECRSLEKRNGAEWDKHCGYAGASQMTINDLAATGVRIGTGGGSLAELAYGVPTMPGSVRFWGGMLDNAARKIYVGGTWSDARDSTGNPELKNFGVLLEVDINFSGNSVGNRKVISGKYLTKQGDVDVGSGNTLHTVRSVKRFNNQFYVYTMDAGNPGTIVRIDPTTGNRSTVWTEKTVAFNAPAPFPADQCENGQVPTSPQSAARRSVQINGLGSPFEMNPVTGEFYLSIIHASNLGSPDGIIKISSDGSTCSWVTRFSATGNNKYADNATTRADPTFGQATGVGPRGTGFSSMTLNSNNLFYRESAGKKWLYAASGSSYWRMDTETGNRELVVQETVGDTNTVWDSSRNVAWSSGVGNGTVLGPIFDFDTANPRVGDNVRCLGTANNVPCMKGVGYAGPMNRGALMFDPLDGNLIFAHNQFGIVRFEVQTGNTYIISH